MSKECDSKCGCNSGGPKKDRDSSRLNRRSFFKLTGGAFLAAKAIGGTSTFGDSCCSGDSQVKVHSTHLVPVEKDIDREWIRSLFDKGEPEIYSGSDLDFIGMPIGGIAAGQMYLLGDGTLGSWHIFNKHIDTGPGIGCYDGKVPAKPVEQGFAVIAKTEGVRCIKRLSKVDFPNVKFLGQYPIGKVWYDEKDCPFTVELEAFSPFIPLNEKDSGLPVTLFHHTVHNRSEKEIEISILGWMENGVGRYSRLGRRRTDIRKRRKVSLFQHSVEEDPNLVIAEVRPKIVMEDFEGSDYGNWQVEGEAFGSGPAQGTLENQNPVSGFEGKGLVNTFLGGDNPHGRLISPAFKIARNYINFLIGGGGHEGMTCMNLIVEW
jgi:non-lysosomal glucosylceramidase